MKYAYFFSKSLTEGSAKMKDLLGGKGANLAEMSSLGIRVPPGFTITAEACAHFSQHGAYPQGMWEEVLANLKRLEETEGKRLGDAERPLLVSVRSGAAVSMPGMMDTVLNLGLNDETVKAVAKGTDERFAYDSYRRFMQMFGDVVLGIDHALFEHALDEAKRKRGVKDDTALEAADLKGVVEAYKRIYEKERKQFPQDPLAQLKAAIDAVFRSWGNDRAIAYRQIHKITGLKGTAVNVQAMVFGNMGDDSGTGVAFTRNPSTGERRLYGEVLFNAQGEDVVAGIRTPLDIEDLRTHDAKAHKEFEDIAKRLEEHYKDMQDIEFTIERGRLYLLQTRSGKRTAAAAVRIAVEMKAEGLIDEKTAILRVRPEMLDQLLHKQLDPKAKYTAIAKGLPASPGAAAGAIVFTAADAELAGAQGRQVILVRAETSPEDVRGMAAAQGILTARGGMTSHAAVVARGMGKCCVVGAESLRIDEARKTITVGETTLKEGDRITLNGSTGEVIVGEVARVDPQISGEFATLMSWADRHRTLKVRTNAETPADTRKALELGAEGIGLARTEHMFFGEDRILAMREFIVAHDRAGREAALSKIEPMQQQDFEEIFALMAGKPVNIRLLDPPLHEFLPKTDEDMAQVARSLHVPEAQLRERVEHLHEMNPMLGHRGCRLAITYPELAVSQVRAIMNAAARVRRGGVEVLPEIMVPLVGDVSELSQLRALIVEAADAAVRAGGIPVAYQVGTMIEVPRAALTAAQVAHEAQFFSFGTNDLTQMTYGISRDDMGKFIPAYIEKGMLKDDPFQVLDQDGVGRLIRMCVEEGRRANPKLKVGICGEHGGEPSSVKFCHRAGFDYVSCSPFRVPIAKLAAAQAALEGDA